jgi:hypothetical protein
MMAAGDLPVAVTLAPDSKGRRTQAERIEREMLLVFGGAL